MQLQNDPAAVAALNGAIPLFGFEGVTANSPSGYQAIKGRVYYTQTGQLLVKSWWESPAPMGPALKSSLMVCFVTEEVLREQCASRGVDIPARLFAPAPGNVALNALLVLPMSMWTASDKLMVLQHLRLSRLQ